MKTLMKPLMTERNSRNLCRRAKHQVRALVNLRMDKTPAQRVHESGHEGFMIVIMNPLTWGIAVLIVRSVQPHGPTPQTCSPIMNPS